MKIVDGWIDDAIEVDYLSQSFGPFSKPPIFIVLHGTSVDAPAENIARNFANSGTGPNGVSTHIIINKDGTFVQGLPLTMTCWGQGNLTSGHASYLPEGINPNMYTIGIEHVKANGNLENLTDPQKNTSFSIIKIICDTYGIPKGPGTNRGGIIRHADIDPINRSHCPGPYPFEDLWNFLGTNGVSNMSPTDEEFFDCWSSTKYLFGGNPPRTNTGIYSSWRQAWYAGHQFGPPLSQEYPLKLFGNQGDVAQEFAHARVEWVNGVPHWYSVNGEITF